MIAGSFHKLRRGGLLSDKLRIQERLKKELRVNCLVNYN